MKNGLFLRDFALVVCHIMTRYYIENNGMVYKSRFKLTRCRKEMATFSFSKALHFLAQVQQGRIRRMTRKNKKYNLEVD